MATADVATAAYDTTSDMTAAAVRLVFFKKEGNKDNGGYTNITQAICSTYSRSQPHHNHTCVAKEKKSHMHGRMDGTTEPQRVHRCNASALKCHRLCSSWRHCTASYGP